MSRKQEKILDAQALRVLLWRMKTLALFLGLSTAICGAQPVTLKNREGKSITGELADISKESVQIKIKGREFSVKLDSLDTESRKVVQKEVEARQEAAAKVEAEKAAEKNAFAARSEAGKKSGAEFRGLWLGMDAADKKKVFKETAFAGKGDALWQPMLGAPADFDVLAENAAGEKFRWQYVFTEMTDGKLSTIAVMSPNFEMKDFRLGFSDWIGAAREAIRQKHGDPSFVWRGDLLLSDVDDGEECRLAVWRLEGTYRVELTVTRDEHYKYYATVCYYDEAVRAKDRAAKEKVKGKL